MRENRLVIALGAEPRLGIVPGATENALPFSTLEDALVGLTPQMSIVIDFLQS
jgi:NADH dehydrogenase FAD-containing subunit